MKSVSLDCNKGHSVVLLDPRGYCCSSEDFSTYLYKWLDEGGSRLVFVIGGADGLPPILKEDFRDCFKRREVMKRGVLSLSNLTFTHQFSRTILMEQIYRASEIRKGKG